MLVDMGFLRTDAVEALLRFSTVPEAAEFLLSLDSNVAFATRSVQRPTPGDNADNTGPSTSNVIEGNPNQMQPQVIFFTKFLKFFSLSKTLSIWALTRWKLMMRLAHRSKQCR